MEIERIETDNDFDGIGSALMIARHLGIDPEKINFSAEKIVDSDEKTLVLDKQSFGDGWIIDHHPLKEGVKREKLLKHDPSGRKPTATLVYEYLKEMGRADSKDLLIAGIAEIADGLDEFGIESGALAELKKNYPVYFEKSPYRNHWGEKERIYTIAGIFYMLSRRDPVKTYKLLESFEVGDLEEELIDKAERAGVGELVKNYLEFCSRIDEYASSFEEVEIAGFKVKISSTEFFDFGMELLGYLERKKPGIYVMLKPDKAEISVRAPEEIAKRLTEYIAGKLGNIVKGYGGRVRWWGIKLRKSLYLEEFLEKIITSAPER